MKTTLNPGNREVTQ